jgi:hypothetical protein
VSAFGGGLRGAALIAVLVGGACSVGLMLRTGQHQNSRILLLLFGIWVLSPFAAAAWAYAVSRRWSGVTRATLYVVILVFTLSSLAIYGAVALGLLRAKVGFVFLVVPFASWLLITIVLPSAALISGRLSAGSKGVGGGGSR